MTILRFLLAFLAAVLVTFVLASVAHSHFVMQWLRDLGVEIPGAVALRTTLGDLRGLATAFLPIVAVALLLGFAVAALVKRFLPSLAGVAYPTGGAAAMAAMLGIMHAAFKMTPIAGARDALGWWLICLAGAAGGVVFALLAQRKRA